MNSKVRQQPHKVPTPPGSHRSRAKRILQHQVPPDNPRHKLAQRRIPIRISRARNRNQRSKLRIAKPRESACDAGHHKAQNHRRPRMFRPSLPGQNKDARPNNRPDPQRNQVQRAQRSFKSAFTLVLRLFQQTGKWFNCQQLRHRFVFSTFFRLFPARVCERPSASTPGTQESPAERSSSPARCIEVCTAIVPHKSIKPSRYKAPAAPDTQTPGKAAQHRAASAAAQTTPQSSGYKTPAPQRSHNPEAAHNSPTGRVDRSTPTAPKASSPESPLQSRTFHSTS